MVRRVELQLSVARRRARNRILDLLGWLAGYCMADTWQDETDQHGPRYSGYSHWRCWVKRSDHRAQHGPNLWHRSNNYRWRPGGDTEFNPIPVAFLNDPACRYGARPGWLRRWPHQAVAPRRRARVIEDYFERTRVARQARQHAVLRNVEAAATAAREANLDRILAEECPHGIPFLGTCQKCPEGWQAAPDPRDPAVGDVVDLGGGWRWRRTEDGWESGDSQPPARPRHAYPAPSWSGRTPCCGRTDQEIKARGEFYAPARVTCTGAATDRTDLPAPPAGEDPK